MIVNATPVERTPVINHEDITALPVVAAGLFSVLLVTNRVRNFRPFR
nr:hypothetical protein [Acidocella sp.]